MQILINDAILADPAQWPDLETLLDHARRNRCYVDVVNPAALSANLWFVQTDRRRQQEWLYATSWAAQDSALYRLHTMVADIAADPDAKPFPKITLPDAINLVSRPAMLWVENDRNDRRFLLSMMPLEQRKMFLELEERWIFRFESRGGLSELRKALEELTGRKLLDPRMNRVLFDSDGEVPNHCSDDALAMIKFCNASSLIFHHLVRRAIENYIPSKALLEWAEASGKKRPERLKKVRAFLRMNESQRHHFHMKSGWDASPSAQVIALFKGVRDGDRNTLRDGIDADIASIYDSFMDAIHEWASKEGIDQGLQTTIDDLMNWIRVPYA